MWQLGTNNWLIGKSSQESIQLDISTLVCECCEFRHGSNISEIVVAIVLTFNEVEGQLALVKMTQW